ncbi:MAG: DUF3288 family protein [Cyanophyceae cyanobacterium]
MGADNNQDQKHPQEKSDRATVNRLLQSSPDEISLVELARLRIRYRNFPGARDIQRDLDLTLKQWQLTEAQLFAQTRQIHALGEVYRRKGREEQQDWS